jgi:hypothetical protein
VIPHILGTQVVKFIEAESRMVVARAQGDREMGTDSLTGITREDEKVLELDDCCFAQNMNETHASELDT